MNDIRRPITEDGQVGWDEFDQLMCWTPTADGRGKTGRVIKDVRELTCAICNHGWEPTAEAMADQRHWQLTDSWVHVTCLIRRAALSERAEFRNAMIDARSGDVQVRFEVKDLPNRYWGTDPYGAKPWYQFDLLDFPIRFIIGARKRVAVVQVEPVEQPPIPKEDWPPGTACPYIPALLPWWKQAEAAFADEDVTKEFGPKKVMLHAWGEAKLKEYVAKLAWFAEGRSVGNVTISLTEEEFDALGNMPWKTSIGDRWKSRVHPALWSVPHVEEWNMGEFIDPEKATSFHGSGDDRVGIRFTRIVVETPPEPKSEEVTELRETIRWMAQTYHQAHHQDQKGTFKECPKNTCDAARQALEK